jgi:hypothetical protein
MSNRILDGSPFYPNVSCRVSLDELHHDLDSMSREGLEEDYARQAESMIGDFEDCEDLVRALNHANAALQKDIALKIRMRDPSVAGILPMLKAEYVRQLENRV